MKQRLLYLYMSSKTGRRLGRQMTQMEVVYRYGATPSEAEMRAIDNLRDV